MEAESLVLVSTGRFGGRGVGGREVATPRPDLPGTPADPQNRFVLTKTVFCALQPLQSPPNHPRNGFRRFTNMAVEEWYFCNLFGMIFFSECEPCSRTPRRSGMQKSISRSSFDSAEPANTRGMCVACTETCLRCATGSGGLADDTRMGNVSTGRVTQRPIFGSRLRTLLSSSLSFSLTKLTNLVSVLLAHVPRVWAGW